jgi:hypothetical protein
MRRPLCSAARLISIALAVSSVPAASFANGPLAVCEAGRPYLWPNGGLNIPYNPDQGRLGPLSNAQAVSLVASAFGQWDAVPTASTSYTNAGPLPVDVDSANFVPYFSPAAPDGLSAIVFDDTGEIFLQLFGPGSGILGIAGPEWVDPDTCTIIEGVAFLNGPSFGNAAEALDVLVHEFGHYQNLAHTVVNGQIVLGDHSGPSPFDTFPIPPLGGRIETMYPFYFGTAAGTSSPHKDDVAGLSTLYPVAAFASSTGTIAGQVLAGNGRTRLTGVNVIARNVANPFDDAVSAISSDLAIDFSQGAPLVGAYRLRGLTAGATYAVYVDEILAGSFSTPPLSPLPGDEEFYSAPNETGDRDTDNPAVFTPIPVPAGVVVGGIDIILNAFKPGDLLPLGDDNAVELSLPFRFDVCGRSFDSVWVNSNGSLTFGAPSLDPTESRFEFLDGPARAAGLWRDLNPSAGGTITFAQTDWTFTVSYTGVPEFPAVGSNTFSIKLYRFFDRIDMTYDGVTSVSGIAGVSCGGAGTSRFEQQQDLSVFRRWFVELWSDAAGYELFSAARPFDLAGSTIRYTGTLDYNDRWAGANNSPAAARRVSLPFSSASALAYTEIERPNDMDFFKFRAKAGQILVAEILTGSIDSVLGLFDGAGVPLTINDDGGAGVLSRIGFVAPADGDYIVGVTTFPDLAFAGAGAETGRYVLSLQALTGTVLPIDDDDSAAVDLGFGFPFQGATYNTVFVNGNGNLTFGGGDTDFSESVADLLAGPPRIAALWDDLFAFDGLVVATPEPGALTVHFVSVPEFFSDRANNFSVRMESSGRITVRYAGVLAPDALVGISQGGGAADPGQTNLSRVFGGFPKSGTTYEQFTPLAPFDLPFRRLRFD